MYPLSLLLDENLPMSEQDTCLNRLKKDQITTRLDWLAFVVGKRMDKVSATMISLLPTEYDWMTPEEKNVSHKLKLQLPSYGEEMLAARERLLIKRAARNKIVSGV